MIHRKSGLVTLYDIRPGNGAGLFLQLRSLYGASVEQSSHVITTRDFPVHTCSFTFTNFIKRVRNINYLQMI